MINVFVKTESHYTIDRSRIRKTIAKILSSRGVKGHVEVSVSIVGDRLMKQLNLKYRELNETTDVLSFPFGSQDPHKPFIDPPDDVLRLGDVVISYPAAREDARQENKMVDDKIDELISHGMMHLLGNHHE